MLRVLLRLTISLIVFFALFILFFRDLVFDDRSLEGVRAALLPPDCAAPCFMGIRPGLTRGEDAKRILVEHPWVDWLENTEVDNPGWSEVIVWSWSGQQPPWISGLSTGVARVKDGLAWQIELETRLPFSDIWLMFGRPDRGALRPRFIVASQPQVVHYAVYDRLGLWLRLETPCPMKPLSFWGAKTRVVIGGSPDEQLEVYDLPGWFADQPDCRR